MDEHKQDARQDAIDMAYYVTDADRDDATKFVDLMISACRDSLASRLSSLECFHEQHFVSFAGAESRFRELEASLDRTNAAIDMLEMGENATNARLDALQLESDRRWAAREDVVASRLDKLDACAVHDAGLIQTLHERVRKLESASVGHGMQVDSLDAQQSSQHEELLGIYRRLNNLELFGKGMTDTAVSHSRQIDALRARADGIEPGSGKQAADPSNPPVAPDRLMAVIADLNLHLTDILGILSRNGVAVRAISSECGNESYLRWERLASKACDNAKAAL